MLAIEVVCDILNWDMLSVHAVHGTREAVVAHLYTTLKHSLGLTSHPDLDSSRPETKV